MGSKSDYIARMGVLYEEHALLGAGFTSSDDGSVIRVVSYPSEKGGPVDSGRAYLHDLSGSSYVLVSGPHASDLIEAAFCGPKISVGECAWQCALTAEGALTSVPLVIRTGANEYVLLDPSDRGDVVVAWLNFLSQIEQNGFAPYAGTKVEDATDMLTPFLMAGNAATAVLSDYVSHPRDLPALGQVKNVYLDKISAVASRVAIPGISFPVFVLLVPPAQASVLWRSFLSFNEVSPVGCVAVCRAIAEMLPWGGLLSEKDKVLPSAAQLESWGLLRSTRDFVGSRCLS